MIEIRCRACHKLAMKVSEDTTGTIETRCKKNTCGQWIKVTLPLGRGRTGGGQTPAPAASSMSNSLTAR